MTVDIYFINGMGIGIEFARDPDYGGTCVVLDLVIFRFLIGFPKDEE
jgi:hypothetical protein